MTGTGQLVVVTGTTGSGKSTTCREFLAAEDGLWLHFGVDTVLGVMTPRKFVDGGPRCAEGVHMAPDDPEEPEGPAHLELGAYGSQLIRAMHDMAAAALRAGQNVVMDHVTTVHPPLLQDCVARLAGLPVLFVGLRPPAELLVKRIDDRLPEVVKVLGPEHAARNNAGTKRVSAYLEREIFSHDCFDLILDSAALAPAEVVNAISDRLRAGSGNGFAALAERLAAGTAPFLGATDGC